MKTLILIHGRSWKPPESSLRDLWIDAIEHGIQRDHPWAISRFRDISIEFVYYGDLSNAFLSERRRRLPLDNSASRRETLELLKQWRTRQFNRRNYNRLPGKESLREGAADVLAPLLRFFRLSDDLIESFAPDIREYWKGEDSAFGSAVREPLTGPLLGALDHDDASVCIVGHSLGTMIAYDTLWKLSYRGEYRPDYCHKKIDYFVTLGSPLGDSTVKAGLFGSRASGKRKYPKNIRRWVNLSAEDDFICHDSRLAGDYRAMKRHGMVEAIKDYKIYNLALRNGKSNPHHSGGYLIHPRFSRVLVDFLVE